MASIPVKALDQWGVSWVIVTGASRGLGAGICEGFATHMAPGSILVGIARSAERLKTTEQKVKNMNSSIKFISVSNDLGSVDGADFERILHDSLHGSESNFQRAILVHNAGSLGPLSYLRSIDDFSQVKKVYDFNVCSVIPQTASFLRVAKSMTSNPTIHVLNISSLCAIAPFKSLGIYCSIKAARDMLFKVLAAEEGESVSVLNYAPGALDGDMQAEIRSNCADSELRRMFQSLKDEKKLVKIEDSVKKFISVLKEGKYASGDHVDFCD